MFHNKGGRGPDSEMRRLPAISLDPMKFVQAFAAGLRAEFADAACTPVPEYLAALMRELDGDQRPQTPISCDGLAETQGKDL
jgi:hypothetical protein